MYLTVKPFRFIYLNKKKIFHSSAHNCHAKANKSVLTNAVTCLKSTNNIYFKNIKQQVSLQLFWFLNFILSKHCFLHIRKISNLVQKRSALHKMSLTSSNVNYNCPGNELDVKIYIHLKNSMFTNTK